ncbi:uncharacterized protein LOC141599133 [Silene latifolia]|uniref:uncharacterized protein LOC141599133 n=1 Tax=Silene latifolia TaxID=37657 RepID=UPI003D76CC61
MDVNKFPALQKVDVAKSMVANNDYTGARSILLELHYQYPSLGNLQQMITVCDVLCAAELTISEGLLDCYWVLQITPKASIPHIKSQHKKLVAVLEGIKDEFPGAVTALKLVHDACFILSNRLKRLIFDSKRLTSWDFSEPAPETENAGCNRGKNMAQEQDTLSEHDVEDVGEKSPKVIDLEGPDKLPEDGEGHNFEDIAHDACWPNDGVGSSLKTVPSNNDPISVNAVASTVHPGLSSEKAIPLLRAASGHEDEGLYDNESNSEAKIFEVGQIWAALDNENLPRRYARINSISDSPFRLDVTWLRPAPETENEEKWCEAELPVVCGLFTLQEDEESVIDKSIFSHWVSYTANPTYDEFRVHPQEDEIWAIYEDWRPFEWFDNPESRKGCNFQIIQILYLKEEECVLVVVPVKLDGSGNICRIDTKDGEESFEIPLSCFYRFSHRLPSYELKDIEKGPSPCGSLEQDRLSNPQSSQSLPSLPVPLLNGSSLKAEWTAADFTPGQVWAIYDGPDQMPRRYTVVNSLMSNKIVSVNLLEPHPMREEEICWVEENLPLGCGVFRVGARTATLQMSKFSHCVNCDRSTKQSFYRIYPKKGEVWAMYRNWNTKWKRHDFDHSGCRIVQITSDFCEQAGVQVASLEQVPGFKTFFQKQVCDGFALNRAVRRTEMLSFSHRVEAFVVPGIQAHGIPECSWHLEPDALPLVFSN